MKDTLIQLNNLSGHIQGHIHWLCITKGTFMEDSISQTMTKSPHLKSDPPSEPPTHTHLQAHTYTYAHTKFYSLPIKYVVADTSQK